MKPDRFDHFDPYEKHWRIADLKDFIYKLDPDAVIPGRVKLDDIRAMAMELLIKNNASKTSLGKASKSGTTQSSSVSQLKPPRKALNVSTASTNLTSTSKNIPENPPALKRSCPSVDKMAIKKSRGKSPLSQPILHPDTQPPVEPLLKSALKPPQQPISHSTVNPVLKPIKPATKSISKSHKASLSNAAANAFSPKSTLQAKATVRYGNAEEGSSTPKRKEIFQTSRKRLPSVQFEEVQPKKRPSNSQTIQQNPPASKSASLTHSATFTKNSQHQEDGGDEDDMHLEFSELENFEAEETEESEANECSSSDLSDPSQISSEGEFAPSTTNPRIQSSARPPDLKGKSSARAFGHSAERVLLDQH
ncbi:hypothetical protein O181_004912 [Austropuccinia psidii MF-1]|uniref:Uncharacterized protein n=1 Tax=Austropuccinia psidii MF-1 TaxID=1389203 RepID=A0A9Q3BHS2_9BASI|nr:hypothetical protein [Austropuccinia psidii MF-1]